MKNILKIVLLSLSLSLSMMTFTMARIYYEDEIPNIYDAYWDQKIARWSTDGFASRFEVVLYREGHRLTSRIVYNQSINFSSYMPRGGYEYYFEVRPYNQYAGWGNWVSSETVYINNNHAGSYYDNGDYYDYRDYNDYYDYHDYHDRYYYNDRMYPTSDGVSYAENQGPVVIIPNNSASTQANVASGNSANIPDPQIVYENGPIPIGAFISAHGGWYYAYYNGVFATNTWIKSGGKWYYLDLTGRMMTGLYTINGKTYYLNTDGSMATGTINVNGVTHYFGIDGAMVY